MTKVDSAIQTGIHVSHWVQELPPNLQSQVAFLNSISASLCNTPKKEIAVSEILNQHTLLPDSNPQPLQIAHPHPSVTSDISPPHYIQFNNATLYQSSFWLYWWFDLIVTYWKHTLRRKPFLFKTNPTDLLASHLPLTPGHILILKQVHYLLSLTFAEQLSLSSKLNQTK